MNIATSALGLLGVFAVACGSAPTQVPEPGAGQGATTQAEPAPAKKNDDAAKPAADAPKTDAPKADASKKDEAAPLEADDDDDDDLGGDAQTVCCVNGQFFECPNAAACLGGFDINACVEACKDAKCFQDCASQAQNAGGPKGCTQKAPPAGVTCE
jgi:hypothetical protein